MRTSIQRFALVVSTVMVLVLSACKGNKDADIQKAVNEKITAASAEIADPSATVKDGVVTLNGAFKDASAKDSFEAAVKAIDGVKSVTNNTTVVAPPPPAPAPVEIAADDPLAKAVTDAVKDYPTVKAEVKDGVITLTGELSKADNRKLIPILQSLKPKKVDNKLTIK